MIKKIILFIVVIIALIAIFVVISYKNPKGNQSDNLPTPSSTISPTPLQNPNWKTFNDTTQHISFKYPENLSTTYIHAQNWPPKIQFKEGIFSCNESGQVAGQALNIKKTIGNVTYCINNLSEGAAGTIYSNYTYTFSNTNKLVAIQFTLAYPQCGNYPEPKMSECQNERQTFNLDKLIDEIAKTVTIQSGNLNLIPKVSSPLPNTIVQSPLLVEGIVPSGWVFEGLFPIKLIDAQRNLILQTQAKEVVAGSWTSGTDIKFTATLNFSTTATSGFIVLQKDNPSGLKENDANYEVPINFK